MLEVLFRPPFEAAESGRSLGEIDCQTSEFDRTDLSKRSALEPCIVGAVVGVDQGLIEQRTRRSRNVRVHQPDRRIGDDFRKPVRKRRGRDKFALGAVDGVRHDIELGREDDPEQPVAPDHEVEELRIVRARRGLDAAVGEHHTKRADRIADRARLMVHAVSIDRDRTADREDIGRLHRLHREARMDGVLDVVPGRSCSHHDGRTLGIELDGVHPPHVEHHPAAAESVAAHAVPHTRRRDRQPRRLGIRKGLLDLRSLRGETTPATAVRLRQLASLTAPPFCCPARLGDLRLGRRCRRGHADVRQDVAAILFTRPAPLRAARERPSFRSPRRR